MFQLRNSCSGYLRGRSRGIVSERKICGSYIFDKYHKTSVLSYFIRLHYDARLYNFSMKEERGCRNGSAD